MPGIVFTLSQAQNEVTVADSTNQAWTDLAIHASDNTKVKSTATAFTAADVGNVLQITAGTGFTVGSFVILSGPDGSGYVTVDAAIGTVGSTSGTGHISWHMVNISGTASRSVASFPALPSGDIAAALEVTCSDGSGSSGSGCYVSRNPTSTPTNTTARFVPPGMYLALPGPIQSVWVNKLTATDLVHLTGLY